MSKMTSAKVTQNERQQANPHVIKLPRATVDACSRPNHRSLAFSYPDDNEGESAVIYATNDDGQLEAAFQGTLTRVSQHGSRQFVIRNAVAVSERRWRDKFSHHIKLKNV